MKGWSAAFVTKQVASGILQNDRNQQRLFSGAEQSGTNYTRHTSNDKCLRAASVFVSLVIFYYCWCFNSLIIISMYGALTFDTVLLRSQTSLSRRLEFG